MKPPGFNPRAYEVKNRPVSTLEAYKVKTWFQSFAIKWVNLYRYSMGKTTAVTLASSSSGGAMQFIHRCTRADDAANYTSGGGGAVSAGVSAGVRAGAGVRVGAGAGAASSEDEPGPDAAPAAEEEEEEGAGLAGRGGGVDAILPWWGRTSVQAESS
jgi:hypothetical protein